MVTPDQQRAAADYLERALRRLAAADLPASWADPARPVRYRRQPGDRRAGLDPGDQAVGPAASAVRLPSHPRDAVRRGWTVNLKRVRRLWIELGLKRPVRLRKPRKLGPKPGASANSCVQTTGPVQGRRLDLRLHPRPDGGWSPAQVADAGGRIYSGVPGAACGRVDDGGRCPADRGPGDRPSRGADPDQER